MGWNKYRRGPPLRSSLLGTKGRDIAHFDWSPVSRRQVRSMPAPKTSTRHLYIGHHPDLLVGRCFDARACDPTPDPVEWIHQQGQGQCQWRFAMASTMPVARGLRVPFAKYRELSVRVVEAPRRHPDTDEPVQRGDRVRV